MIAFSTHLTHYLLLDYDDTLAGTELPAFQACAGLVNEVLALHGVTKRYTPQELKAFAAGKTFAQNIRDLAKMYELLIHDDRIRQLAEEETSRVIAKFEESLEATDGSNEFLAAMHSKIPMAVVSSSRKRRLRVCLRKTGQHEFFTEDRVFSATSLGVEPKPDPAIYIHATQSLEVAPQNCLAVEDSRSGVRSAVGAGIPVVGYVGALPVDERPERKQVLRESGAIAVVDHWDEFLPVAGKLVSWLVAA